MKIVIANDHAAAGLKERLKSWMTAQGHQVTDLGTAEGEKADYPDKAVDACRVFRDEECDFGVLLCGTGIGISITANKIKGIRCALPQNVFAAQMAREHNNCRFIAFGARIEYQDSPVEMLKTFLETPYSEDERHERRVVKMMAAEES